jgi:hypothetical protein
MRREHTYTKDKVNAENEQASVFHFSFRKQIVLFLSLIIFWGCSEKEDTLSNPTVSSRVVSEIGYETATSGGNITSDGGNDIIAKGVCWSVSNTPTIADSKTTDGSGVGNYTSSLVGLLPSTTYYLRAYASNDAGTSYGEEISFTTNETPVYVPILSTTAMSEITSETASSGGEISSDGGSDIIDRGVCWSISNAPSIADSKTTNGTGTGSFTSSLAGLIPNTTYYLKAYASNSSGTSYGEEISFTTNEAPVELPIVTSTAISEISTTTATSGGSITSDGGSDIIARGVCWSISNLPSIADSKTSDGTGTGNFTSSLTELLSNTAYYLRAYATNNAGTSYGEEIGFTTSGNKIYSGDIYLNNQQEVDDFGSMGYTLVTGDLIIEPALPTSFSNLNGLNSLTSIGGALIISKTIGLQNLSGLKNLATVEDYIILSYNQGLTSIGLESLTSVGNYFNILFNDDLINLEGLTMLRSNGGNPDLTIWSNGKLKDFCGIKPLLSDFTGVFSVMSNLYNPTQQDIIDGNCSQ